jgi:general secretion pathway protein E
MAQSGALQKVAGSSGGVQPEQTAPREQVERELSTLANRDLLASGDKAPVARLVDNILFDALSRKASDVHIHPYPAPGNKLVIRYRVDGVLFDAFTPDPRLHEQLVGRIKVLAGMDVAEKRLPQDGRTSVTIGGMRSGGSGAEGGGRQIDLRVSTLLTTCGERVVIRLLEQTARL